MLLLDGDHAAAVEALRGATKDCRVLDHPVAHHRAYLWLGQAHEALDHEPQACAAYAHVLSAWADATPRSLSAETARAASETLGCETAK